ncbi:hypothetical protein UVI_02017540 [Ustilaginoidea virens]|nr:hypothetical protein UVI_02017540 [Ustilaginoidea virens]
MDQSVEQPRDANVPKLPGYGLPVDFMPPKGERFPVLVGDRDDGWLAATLTRRESCMLKVMEDLTNKPDWWRKVRDPSIAARWKDEILAVDWAAHHPYADFTPKMADACIEELLKKAHLYEATSLIPVLDYSAAVIKSDALVPDSLLQELSQAVKVLEEVPDDEKDWHPGSDRKVLDLVHPSLYPLTYGRSRILPAKEINAQDCLDHAGSGEIIPRPDAGDLQRWGNEEAFSCNYQWLPSNVAIGQEGDASITSYINNLHPVKHRNIYPIIERFITKSLPAWDLIYRWPDDMMFQRLSTAVVGPECSTEEACAESYECLPSNRPLDEDEPPREEDEEEDDGYDESERSRRDIKWFMETHPAMLPDAVLTAEASSDEQKQRLFSVTPDMVKTSGFFNSAQRLQVIVKLASIHLTPQNPRYDGGSWHIEGQLNEHICATALYYYDSDNISESRLAFRTSADTEELSFNLDYKQGDVRSIARTFAVDQEHEASTLQDVGSVLTKQGRAIFFPNVLQHQVQPFSLVDETRPGHRKILALFLVDPAIPVISTANVPPQQRHWWLAQDNLQRGSRLPPEITQMVLDNMHFVIGDDEAKRVRKELMSERTKMQRGATETLKQVNFNFCEH